jgi:hypothetical protein
MEKSVLQKMRMGGDLNQTYVFIFAFKFYFKKLNALNKNSLLILKNLLIPPFISQKLLIILKIIVLESILVLALHKTTYRDKAVLSTKSH